MTTYMFRCQHCKYDFEKEISMTLYAELVDSNKLELVCPRCGIKAKPIRILTLLDVRYKGSGFYTTDRESTEIDVNSD